MANFAASRDAEWKIEEALRTRATILNLRPGDNSLPLSKLPESLGKLTQLQTLNLRDNELTALPEWIGKLAWLQSLDLGGNRLTALPESLCELTQLQTLNLSDNELTALPESLGKLTWLLLLDLGGNQLTTLTESLCKITQLQSLVLSGNELTALPESLGKLTRLCTLDLSNNRLTALPESLNQLTWLNYLNLDNNLFGKSFQDAAKCFRMVSSLPRLGTLWFRGNQLSEVEEHLPALLGILARSASLRSLFLSRNQLSKISSEIALFGGLESLSLNDNRLNDLPSSLGGLRRLIDLDLDGNPLNPEFAAAYKQDLDALKCYLRARAEAQVILNEAKLILIGEGEVGKSCLLGALRGDPWEEGRPTTHGIEIKRVKVTDPDSGREITLNGWDFGGQRVYRPTHQLFFSAPAVYLVVWKPREGPQQGSVKEWIKLVKYRAPDARILVVATHGGPKERQPDIDRQEIWDMFGKETVIDFFHVDSCPMQLNKKIGKQTGTRKGLRELTDAIARAAAGLPEMGRTFPENWQKARTALQTGKEAYLPLDRVLDICKEHKIEEDDARLLLRICCQVGNLIHYEHDPKLRDIVVLKPDWLATAISFVLNDRETREVGHGLVSFKRLGQLWQDNSMPKENRYPAEFHPVFLRLMELFDLSYRVAEAGRTEADGTSLIAQLVPDVRPDLVPVWNDGPADGDATQVQICRIVDSDKNQSATAEGLFYQLIVRLHKYSLGRVDFAKSVHWQRGLVLEDDAGARAFLEHIGNDVRITVRSPYPERFLSALTYEVKWLVESFWKGMRCEVTVPCLIPRENGEPCIGLFEVRKLIENKKRNRPEQPCPICNEWQSIEQLLHNAPVARQNPLEDLLTNSVQVKKMLEAIRRQVAAQHTQVIGRFDRQDATSRELVSKVEAAYDDLMHTLVDEAKDAPRLFSFEPAEPGFFDRPKWISAKFRVTLWCEHSRRPLPALNGKGDKRGVYELTLPLDWFIKAAPFLKVLTATLSLVTPVASSATKLVLDDAAYKDIVKQLDLGQKSLDSVLKGGAMAGAWLGHIDAPDFEEDKGIEAHGAGLRQLQTWLKEKDPGFGGLVRVQNKRREFLWVHPQFEKEY